MIFQIFLTGSFILTMLAVTVSLLTWVKRWATRGQQVREPDILKADDSDSGSDYVDDFCVEDVNIPASKPRRRPFRSVPPHQIVPAPANNNVPVATSASYSRPQGQNEKSVPRSLSPILPPKPLGSSTPNEVLDQNLEETMLVTSEPELPQPYFQQEERLLPIPRRFPPLIFPPTPQPPEPDYIPPKRKATRGRRNKSIAPSQEPVDVPVRRSKRIQDKKNSGHMTYFL